MDKEDQDLIRPKVDLRKMLAEWREQMFAPGGYSRIIEDQTKKTAQQFQLSDFWTAEINPIRSTARERFGGWMEIEWPDPPQGG